MCPSSGYTHEWYSGDRKQRVNVRHSTHPRLILFSKVSNKLMTPGVLG